MTIAAASVSWAVASILDSAGLVDFRPDGAGSDVFLDRFPQVDVPDAAVEIRDQAASIEYGVHGFETQVRITVRGTVDGALEARDRAAAIFKELMRVSRAPVTVSAGPGLQLTVCGLFPVPATVSRFDLSGRPEFVMVCRVSHDDLL